MFMRTDSNSSCLKQLRFRAPTSRARMSCNMQMPNYLMHRTVTTPPSLKKLKFSSAENGLQMRLPFRKSSTVENSREASKTTL